MLVATRPTLGTVQYQGQQMLVVTRLTLGSLTYKVFLHITLISGPCYLWCITAVCYICTRVVVL